MSNYPQSYDHMLIAWNESDATLVRERLERALSPGIRFVDPSIDVTGIDSFESKVHDVQGKLPGAVYSRTTGVDSQHGSHRYHWAIHQEGELIVPGFDVVQTDDSGWVIRVIGSFGRVPES
ncbi:MAG: hypothetical protein ACJASY_003592 [Halioglobus sp.]|jgi:hypothetical protein